MKIEESVRKAMDVLNTYDIFFIEDFYGAEMEQLGIITGSYFDKIHEHFNESELCHEIAKETDLSENEEFLIYVNKYFFHYFDVLKKNKDKFIIDGKNYFDFITEQYKNKFFVDFDNLKDWLKTYEELCYENTPIENIFHGTSNLSTEGLNQISNMFDYIDLCSPEIPRFYFNNNIHAIMMSFNIKLANSAINKTDFNWKHFFNLYFNVPESAWRNKENGFDSLIFIYLPGEEPKISFNGIEYKKNYIEKDWRYATWFTEYFELRFHHVFFVVTKKTIYEWYCINKNHHNFTKKEEGYEWNYFEQNLEHLKWLHRLMITDGWKYKRGCE